MNGKLAKKIRRAAEKQTVGQPEQHLVGRQHKNKRVTALHHPQTTRSFNRWLKRAFKKSGQG